MPSRRRFLAALGTAGSAALAGCNSVPFVGGGGGAPAAEPSDDFPSAVHVPSGWPNARRDPAHTACVPDADDVSAPSVEWRSEPVPFNTVPSVAGATVVCGADGLLGLDVVSGDQLWTGPGDTGRNAPPVVDGLAYSLVGTIPDRAMPGVAVVDVVDGTLVNSFEFPEKPRVPPTRPYDPDRERRFFPFRDGVAAFTKHGEHSWLHDVFGAVAFPLAYNAGVVVAATAAGELYAFGRTGDEAWRTDLDDRVTVPPVVGSSRVYAGTQGEVVALSRYDGGVAWRVDAPPAGPFALDDGRLYVPRNRGLEARSPQTGGVVWEREFGERVTAAPAVGGSTVYVGTRDGSVHALDAASGDEQWSASAGATVGPRLAVAGGRLYTVAKADGAPRVTALA